MTAVEAADVLVVGAGLAGLHTATGLARRGHDVLLVDRRTRLDGAVRTTGIFVAKTLHDFALPPAHLGPPIRRVALYPPSGRRPVVLDSPREEFRVGDMGPLYLAAAADAVDAGVRIELATRFLGRDGDRWRLAGPAGDRRVRARFVVGADGARSRVAAELGLDRNRQLLVGAEEVFATRAHDRPPTFHCVLDPELAPGYLAWVVDDGVHVHVGVAGYPDRYPGGLRAALRRFAATAPGLPGPVPEDAEHRGGPIPVGGLLRRISSTEGVLVGDASGAVSPLTAGGLDPCLRQAAQAVEVLDHALRTGSPQALAGYDGAELRTRFRGRLALRRGLAAVRSRGLVEAGFPLLRTPVGRVAARAVLFGDRSFPDRVSGDRAAGVPARPPAAPARRRG